MQKKNKSREKDYRSIDISRVSAAPDHIRKNVADTASLKCTISDVGLLQPVLVREDNGNYIVIDGARRLQALKELEVPELIVGRDVIIDVEETEADAKFKQLIANVQREDVSDIELGHAFVALKEKYGYQYVEMAEIIGKTPHYVSAKVGLAKRLTIEVQGLVAKDLEAAKCIRNTSSGDSDDPADPYVMNVNVIEDIAQLPPEVQRPAYETIRENEMDKKEALKYLRSVKRDADVLKLAEDVRGLIAAYSTYSHEKQIYPEKELSRYLRKLDNDVDKLSVTIKAGPVDVEKTAPALKSLIHRLSLLYSELKGQNISPRAFLH
jgi:ParB family chromosome partitioning protein